MDTKTFDTAELQEMKEQIALLKMAVQSNISI
jgi:hypothetical protein